MTCLLVEYMEYRAFRKRVGEESWTADYETFANWIYSPHRRDGFWASIGLITPEMYRDWSEWKTRREEAQKRINRDDWR